MILLNKKIGALVLLLGLSPMTLADVVGVGDAALLANAVKQLAQLEEQYKLLKESHDNAKSQLDAVEKLKSFNSGTYGHGSFENGLDSLKNWENPADNWKEALEHISGGNQARYAELVKGYEESHPMISDAIYSKNATPNRLAKYQYNKKINKAISVETTKTFNEINARLKSVNTLALKIDQTPNTKSSVDLNSRITAELAYIALMNLKLQTLVSQQLAQNTANELADEGEMVQFNSLGIK